jgi:hypothetical protein
MLWERTGRQAPTSLRGTVAQGDEIPMNSTRGAKASGKGIRCTP